jgi:hypothetical protein
MGEHDKSLMKAKEAIRRNPTYGLFYAFLAKFYMYLNRLNEARATVGEAQAKSSDSPDLRLCLYQIFFLQDDASGMAQQLAWSAGKPDVEDQLLASQGYPAAYSGRLTEARELWRRAIASSTRGEKKEAAAGYETGAAAPEACLAMRPKPGNEPRRHLPYRRAATCRCQRRSRWLQGIRPRQTRWLMTWQNTSHKTRQCSSFTCQYFTLNSRSTATTQQRPLKPYSRPRPANWGVQVVCTPCMCKHI